MKSNVSTTGGIRWAGSPLVKLGWLVADSWTITLRDLQHWRQQPATVIVGWVFPVMIVLMFGLLFGGALKVPEGASYFEFLMPGMFTLTMLFGLEATVIAVTTDAARGVTDRFRSMPISAGAVVLGRCLADMLNSLVGLVILLVSGLLLGWRWHGNLGGALLAVGLLMLLRFSLLWLGIFVGLVAKGPEVVTAVQILVWPVGFLSNVFVDPATMPEWLGGIAAFNPLSATAAANRQLFGNPGWQSSGLLENAILLAVGWPLVLVVIFLPLAVRKYRQLSR